MKAVYVKYDFCWTYDIIQFGWLKCFPVNGKVPGMLQSRSQGCWLHSNMYRQSININGIELGIAWYSGVNTSRIKTFSFVMESIECNALKLIKPVGNKYASLEKVLIGSYDGLSPGWCHPINWTNAGLLTIGRWGIHFNKIETRKHCFCSINCTWYVVNKTLIVLPLP